MAAYVYESAMVLAKTLAEVERISFDTLEWARLPQGQETRMHGYCDTSYLSMGLGTGGLYPVRIVERNEDLSLFSSPKFVFNVLVRRVSAGRKQLTIHSSVMDHGVAFQALSAVTGDELATIVMKKDCAIRGHDLQGALRDQLVLDSHCTPYTQLVLISSKSHEIISRLDTVFHPRPKYEPEIKRRKIGKQPKGWWISEAQFMPVSNEALATLI